MASGCWYVFESPLPICWQNCLSSFRKILFCLHCFTLCRYLFNLPSFASTFWFISSSCIVICSCVAWSFLFLHIPASFLFVSSFWPVFVNVLFTFLVENLIQVLIFLSCFLRGSQFSRKLIWLLHRLVHLIEIYYLLIYISVLDLLYSPLLNCSPFYIS